MSGKKSNLPDGRIPDRLPDGRQVADREIVILRLGQSVPETKDLAHLFLERLHDLLGLGLREDDPYSTREG